MTTEEVGGCLAGHLGDQGVADRLDTHASRTGVEHAGLADELVRAGLTDGQFGALLVDSDHPDPPADDQEPGIGGIAVPVQVLAHAHPTPRHFLAEIVERQIHVPTQDPGHERGDVLFVESTRDLGGDLVFEVRMPFQELQELGTGELSSHGGFDGDHVGGASPAGENRQFTHQIARSEHGELDAVPRLHFRRSRDQQQHMIGWFPDPHQRLTRSEFDLRREGGGVVDQVVEWDAHERGR